MRITLASLVIFFFILHFKNAKGNDLVNKLQQNEIHWIILKIGEVSYNKVEAVLNELNGRKEKIKSAEFERETRLLTVHYYNNIRLDDIYELINIHITNYEKISGSQL